MIELNDATYIYIYISLETRSSKTKTILFINDLYCTNVREYVCLTMRMCTGVVC